MKQEVANIYKKAKASRRNKTREKLRKLTLLLAFPSEAVVSAYVSPAMESEERFSWAVLNLVGVMDFAMDRFGWDNCQVEKLLKSVIRALEVDNWQYSCQAVSSCLVLPYSADPIRAA